MLRPNEFDSSLDYNSCRFRLELLPSQRPDVEVTVTPIEHGRASFKLTLTDSGNSHKTVTGTLTAEGSGTQIRVTPPDDISRGIRGLFLLLLIPVVMAQIAGGLLWVYLLTIVGVMTSLVGLWYYDQRRLYRKILDLIEGVALDKDKAA